MTANRYHVAAGCWFGRLDQMTRTLRQGARFNVFSNDSALLNDAMQQSFSARPPRPQYTALDAISLAAIHLR